MPRADPSLVNHSYFDVTKDHLAVNPDTLLCRFFQFPSLLLPEILPSSMHIYASVACYPHSIVTKKKPRSSTAHMLPLCIPKLLALPPVFP